MNSNNISLEINTELDIINGSGKTNIIAMYTLIKNTILKTFQMLYARRKLIFLVDRERLDSCWQVQWRSERNANTC